MENQVEEQLTPPTDEQATAFLNNDQAVEQSSQPKQAPEPSTGPTASLDTATIQQMLKEALNPIQSELGQFRKMRSEMERQKTQPKQTTPQSWASMTPEQQAEVQEMVGHAWQQQFGKDWEAIQSEREQAGRDQQIRSVVGLAENYAGENYKEIDPIMGRLYSGFLEKAKQGDTESQELVWEIKNTRSGVKYLVDLAKQELAKEVEAKSGGAKAVLDAKGKKVGVNLGGGTQAQPQANPLNNLPSDPAEAAKVLRAELVKRGALT